MNTFADELAEWPIGPPHECKQAMSIPSALLRWGRFLARDDASVCYVGDFSRLECPGDLASLRIVLSVFDGEHQMAFRPDQVFAERLGHSATT